MALARVRGCAGQARLAAQAASEPPRQADASRRQNGPRKATFRRLITVRLRSKSCPAGGHNEFSDLGRRSVVAMEGASTSAGGCGVEDQVGRASAFLFTDALGGSRDGNHLQRQ